MSPKHEWYTQVKQELVKMKRKDDGITRRSLAFLRAHKEELAELAVVELLMPRGMEYPDSHVRWIDKDDNYMETTGFAWGYGGEGPRGLRDAFALFGVKLELQEIAAWQDEHYLLSITPNGVGVKTWRFVEKEK